MNPTLLLAAAVEDGDTIQWQHRLQNLLIVVNSDETSIQLMIDTSFARVGPLF